MCVMPWNMKSNQTISAECNLTVHLSIHLLKFPTDEIRGDKVRSSSKTSSYTKILELHDTQKAISSGVAELIYCECLMPEL